MKKTQSITRKLFRKTTKPSLSDKLVASYRIHLTEKGEIQIRNDRLSHTEILRSDNKKVLKVLIFLLKS